MEHPTDMDISPEHCSTAPPPQILNLSARSSPVDPRFPVIPPDACMPCQSAPKKRKTFLASAGSKSRLRIWCYTKELPQLDTSELSDGVLNHPPSCPSLSNVHIYTYRR
ncbi:hypothetical protein TWF706_005714 [Orbilia oligospora]|nr:hypothetical protein TWF706_005714 [Orbilia oligospora]